MASKTVKRLIIAGNSEYPCKGLCGAQSQPSTANRLMSTMKRQWIVFVPRLYRDNYFQECFLGAVILLQM